MNRIDEIREYLNSPGDYLLAEDMMIVLQLAIYDRLGELLEMKAPDESPVGSSGPTPYAIGIESNGFAEAL